MKHPLLYQINTRCWLRSLAKGAGTTLADVPDSEFKEWTKLGFTHIWLMGVWTTGPHCRELALKSKELRARFDEILPGWREEDVPGSPYAIADYHVPAALGGDAGLKAFRERLNRHGMKLLLDFVPNHLGMDHPWTVKRPELLMQTPEGAAGSFRQETDSGTRWLAHGKDPNFPPWSDTVQIDYRVPAARKEMIELLRTIAGQCDGVRCDMAMLLLNEVFAKTWAHIPPHGPVPATEFWTEAISAVKQEHPNFLFLAEVYWGKEPQLQALGFDYTYDKEFFDDIMGRRPAVLRQRLMQAKPEILARGAHFLENHDEKRVAENLPFNEHRAAALLMLALPGMRFLYEGQLAGWRIQSPAQLGRWPGEPVNAEIHLMNEQLFAALGGSAVGNGDWKLLLPESNPGTRVADNLIVVQWQKSPDEFDLVTVNLSGQPGQGHVQPAVNELSFHDWLLSDRLGRESRKLHGGDLQGRGFSLDLPAHGTQFLHFRAVDPPGQRRY